MNKFELIGLLEKEVERERELLKDESMYPYQLVESAMRLNVMSIAIDKLDDIEEDFEFSEEDMEEFLGDLLYVGDSAYENFVENIDLMNWENKIGKVVFEGN
jgi:hypothetical protein